MLQPAKLRRTTIISILLIMVMTAFPMLSAAASVNKCSHTNQTSMVINANDSISSNNQLSDMDAQHDCCDKPNITCSHDGMCDCDNGQVSSSLVNTVSTFLQTYGGSSFKTAISPIFLSKVSDSLYRPPILIL